MAPPAGHSTRAPGLPSEWAQQRREGYLVCNITIIHMLLGGKRDIKKKVHPALSGLASSLRGHCGRPGGTITPTDLQDLIVDAEGRSSSSFKSGETPATGLASLMVEYEHQRSKVLDQRLISCIELHYNQQPPWHNLLERSENIISQDVLLNTLWDGFDTCCLACPTEWISSVQYGAIIPEVECFKIAKQKQKKE